MTSVPAVSHYEIKANTQSFRGPRRLASWSQPKPSARKSQKNTTVVHQEHLETLNEQPSQLVSKQAYQTLTGSLENTEDPYAKAERKSKGTHKLYNFKELIYKRRDSGGIQNLSTTASKLPSIPGISMGQEQSSLLGNLTIFSYDKGKDQKLGKTLSPHKNKNYDIYEELANKRYIEHSPIPQLGVLKTIDSRPQPERHQNHSPFIPPSMSATPSRIPEIVRFARHYAPLQEKHELKANFKITPAKSKLVRIQKVPLIERKSSHISKLKQQSSVVSSDQAAGASKSQQATPVEDVSEIMSSPKVYQPGIFKGRGSSIPTPPPLELSRIITGRESYLNTDLKAIKTSHRPQKIASTRTSSLVTQRSKDSINQAFKTFTNFNKLLHGKIARPMVAPVPYSFGIKFKNLSQKVRYEKQIVEIMKLKKLIMSEPSTSGQHLLEFLTLHLSPTEFASSITPEKIIMLTRAVQLFEGMEPGLTTRDFILRAFSGEIEEFAKNRHQLSVTPNKLTPIPSKRSTRYSKFDFPGMSDKASLTYTTTFQFKESVQEALQGDSEEEEKRYALFRQPSPDEPEHYKITQQHRKKRLPSSTFEPNRLEFVLGRYISKTAKIKVGEIKQPAVDLRPKHKVGRLSNPIAAEIERLNHHSFRKVENENMEQGVMKRNKLMLEHVMHKRSKDKNMSQLHSAYFDHLRKQPLEDTAETEEILEETGDPNMTYE